MRSEHTFGQILRGLQVFGYGVLDGKALAQAIVTPGSRVVTCPRWKQCRTTSRKAVASSRTEMRRLTGIRTRIWSRR